MFLPQSPSSSVPLPSSDISHFCYELGVNCSLLSVISGKEKKNQSSNEGNQNASQILEPAALWMKWATNIHKRNQGMNIQELFSSKGTVDEQADSVWTIQFNCQEMKGEETFDWMCVCVCASPTCCNGHWIIFKIISLLCAMQSFQCVYI